MGYSPARRMDGSSNVCGLDAVAITLRDGRKFALGQRTMPQALVDAIEAFDWPRVGTINPARLTKTEGGALADV